MNVLNKIAYSVMQSVHNIFSLAKYALILSIIFKVLNIFLAICLQITVEDLHNECRTKRAIECKKAICAAEESYDLWIDRSMKIGVAFIFWTKALFILVSKYYMLMIVTGAQISTAILKRLTLLFQ